MKRSLTTRRASALLLFLSTSVAVAQAPPPAGQNPPAGGDVLVLDPSKLPEIVARVDGADVTRRELITQGDLTRAQIGDLAGKTAPELAAFYRHVLEGLIGEMLIFEESRRLGKAASDAQVEEAVGKLRARFPDQESFEKGLAAQGVTLDQVRGQIRRALSIERYVFEVIGGGVTVGDPAKRAFYDKNRGELRLPEQRRVRHILLRVKEDANAAEREAVKSRLLGLKKRIEGGEDFAALARTNSEDPGSRDQGGELSWVQQTGQRPKFETAVFALQMGRLSEPIETGAGYHLVELLEVQPSRERPFEEVERQIEQYLKNAEIQKRLQAKVEELRKTAKVEILL